MRAIHSQPVVTKVTSQDAHHVHVFTNRHDLTIRVAIIAVRTMRKVDSVLRASVQAYRAVLHRDLRENTASHVVAIVHVSIQITVSRVVIALAITRVSSREVTSHVVAMVNSAVAMVSSREAIAHVTISSQKVRRVDISLVSKVVMVSLVNSVVAMVSSVAATVSSAVVMVSSVAAMVSSVAVMIPMPSIH